MWIPLLIGSIILVIALISLIFTSRKYMKNIYDQNFLIFYDFTSYFLILNICILLFLIVYYYYRKSIPGIKGPKGDIGAVGDQGHNSFCGICEKRDNKFTPILEPKIPDSLTDTSTIDNFVKNNRIKDIVYKNSIKGLSNRWNAHVNLNKDFKNHGDTSMICNGNETNVPPKLSHNPFPNFKRVGGKHKESCKNSGAIQSNTYINGAILRIDPDNNDLYSLQYMQNKETKNGRQYINSTENLGGPNGRWGGDDFIIKYKDKKEEKEHITPGKQRGKYYDFKCPKGSGIYRIDTLSEPPSNKSGNIKGIKFYCRDTKTGKDIKLNTPMGQNMDGIHFGVDPNINNKRYIYNRTICKKINKDNNLKPSFISKVGAIHGQKINSLQFYNCSYRK